MTLPRIIRLHEVRKDVLPGIDKSEAGWMRRIIYPRNVEAQKAFFGIIEVNPGFSPHRWHKHVSDQAENYEVSYPKGFEEIYHIMEGKGKVQWRTGNGDISEEDIGRGDTLFFGEDIVEHQVLNTGKTKMVIAFCGSPIPLVKLSGASV